MNGFKLSVMTAAGVIVLFFMLIAIEPEAETTILKQSAPSKTMLNSDAKIVQDMLQHSNVQGPRLKEQSANQKDLLRQRDQLYAEFEAINQKLSQGQKPEERTVDTLLQQQMQLVHAGVLSSQDALNYCQFLRKVMPEMDRQLNGYILELEKM